MRTEWLEEFVALATYRGFNNASRRLYLSQSTLSAHIAALEAELGAELVDRGAHEFALTRAGKVFLGYAMSIGELMEEARDAVRREQAGCHAVRIPSDLVGRDVLSAVRTGLGVEFKFVDLGIDATHLDALANDKIDIGVAFAVPTGEGELVDPSVTAGVPLVAKRFCGMELAVVCGSAHPLARLPQLTRDDLRGATVLMSSLAWFDMEKRAWQEALGEGLGLKFALRVKDGLTDLAYSELGDMVYVCGRDSVTQMFGDRDDIVIFDRLDEQPIRVESAVLAFRAADRGTLVEETVDAMIRAIERLGGV